MFRSLHSLEEQELALVVELSRLARAVQARLAGNAYVQALHDVLSSGDRTTVAYRHCRVSQHEHPDGAPMR